MVGRKKGVEKEKHKVFCRVVSNWLYDFLSTIETEEEEQESLKLLHGYIDNAKVSNDVKVFASAFIDFKFRDLLPQMCHRHFMGLRHGFC